MRTMRTRPPEYAYFQGYMMVLAALISLSFGLVRWEWPYFAWAAVFTLTFTLFFAYLAWWRRSYERAHPGDIDAAPFMQTVADKYANSAARLIGMQIPLNGNSQTQGRIAKTRRPRQWAIQLVWLIVIGVGLWVIYELTGWHFFVDFKFWEERL